MRIRRSAIVKMLKERGLAGRAGEAEQRLPKVVETERDLGLLSEFGVAADDVAGGLGEVTADDPAGAGDPADDTADAGEDGTADDTADDTADAGEDGTADDTADDTADAGEDGTAAGRGSSA